MLKNRTLYFGDNLRVLREKFPPNPEGYFDLIYLDPPFNSNRNYNVLFKEGAEDSQAQLHAFEDTWYWSPEVQEQYEDLVKNPVYPQRVSDLIQGLEKLIGHNDMMAYLVMMTIRLIELHRVLKPTGTLWLHCDSTASHYLKIVLDALFGLDQFQNEIIWIRTNAHNIKTRRFGRVHDSILFYSKSKKFTWNSIYLPYSDEQLSRYKPDENGRLYTAQDLTIATASAARKFEWRGTRPPEHRGWGSPIEQLETLWSEGKILKKKDGKPRLDGMKVYLDEMPGKPAGSVWSDIQRIGNTSSERMGYPTQKPIALLERIIQATTDEYDWVLDPFGGCGTTAVAAEKLNRNWCIIDITPLAINLVKRRIEDMYPEAIPNMTVDGYPADEAGARELFKRSAFDFEYWCCDLVNARPGGDKTKDKMKGADRGIDGVITFQDVAPGGSTMEWKRLLVQVKGGKVQASQIRDLVGTVQREKAAGGVFISLEEPTKPMMKDVVEAGSYTYNLNGQKYPVIQILTVKDLLQGKVLNHPPAISYSKRAERVQGADGTMSMF